MTSNNKYPWTLVGELPPIKFVAEYAVQLTEGKEIPDEMLRLKPPETSLWYQLAAEMYPSGATVKIETVAKDLCALFRSNFEEFYNHVNVVVKHANNPTDNVPLEGLPEFTMEFTRKEWSTMSLLATTYLSPGWTEIVYQKFSLINKRCVLSFQNNHLKKENSRKKNCRAWYGTAACVFKGCCRYKLEIGKLPTSNESHVSMKCVRDGDFNHAPGEKNRRPLQGDARLAAKKELKSTPPSKLAAKQRAMADDSVIALGNLSDYHSQGVLRKAHSEETTQRHLSPDPWIALCAVTSQLDQTCGKDTVSILSFRPLMVAVNTTEQLQVWRGMTPKNRILYVDATGGVVRPPIWTEKKVLIYNASVMIKKGTTPIPISFCISDGHSQNELGFWFGRIKKQYMAVMKVEFPPPSIVLVDYSWAIIHAAVLSFFGMKILEYLKACKNAKENGLKIPILMVCYSHILNAVSVHVYVLLVKRGTYTVKENLEVKRLALHTFASILRTTTIPEAKRQFRLLCVVFGSKFSTTSVSESHLTLMKTLVDDDEFVTTALKLEKKDDESDSDDSESDSDDPVCPVKIRKNRKEVLYKDSPFYKDFEEETEVPQNGKGEKNKWFIPGFVKYLMKKYLPFYPLISNYMTITAGWTKENPPTTTTVEQDFRVMKNVDFKGKASVPLDIFVQENTSNALQKIKMATTDECTKTYKRSVEKSHPDRAEEGWQKKRKKGLPAYNKLAAKLRYGTTGEGKEEENVDDPPPSAAAAIKKQEIVRANVSGPWNLVVPDHEALPLGWCNAKVPLNCGGFDILHSQRVTLTESNGWVDSQIIDIFLQGLVNKACQSGKQAQSLSTYLIPGLLHSGGKIQLGWAEKRNLHIKPVWLVPLNVRDVHWSLGVVLLARRQIIILDTRTDGTFADVDLYEVLLRFVLTVMDASGSPSANETWSVHRPTDINEQGNSDDCGVHVMLWAYAVLMKVFPVFYSGIAARSWIARFIAEENCNIPNLPLKEGTKWRAVSTLKELKSATEVSTRKLEPDTYSHFMDLEL